MYQDLLLRFADEAEARSLLYADDKPLFTNIDIIGTICEPLLPPTFDSSGELLPQAPVPLPGWHVNVRLVLSDEDGTNLEPFRVYPAHPVRGWLDTPIPPVPSYVPPDLSSVQSDSVVTLDDETEQA